MKLTSHTAAVLAIGALLIVGTAACGVENTAQSEKAGATGKLPPDTDKEQSKKNAQEFRSWVQGHGTSQQKYAVGRVTRIVGEWDEKTGNAYISTDVHGGKTEVKDPRAAAAAVADAFADWKDSEQGYVSVYDVFGTVLVTNTKF